jgi:hypothetical protein
MDRQSICFSSPEPGMVIHSGQDGFKEKLRRLYAPAESIAAERLVKLKETLRKSDSETFWTALAQGLTAITDSQYAFVSKRILVDDDNTAVEMPPIGEPGSCLMGAAYYFNEGQGSEQVFRNLKYHAYSCPCAHMRHDKIFIIPDHLTEFTPDNPNKLAVPGEAYIGIPLFADGKCSSLRRHVDEGGRRTSFHELGLSGASASQSGGHDPCPSRGRENTRKSRRSCG